jgi:hypothetical protein
MFAWFLRAIAAAAAASALLAAPATAASKPYTGVDFGAPPASLAPQLDAYPDVFNNTGQIAGTYSPAVGNGPWCLVYTGKAWITMTYPTARLCEAWAISDASSSGTYGVVGRIGTEFESGDKGGYYATISGSTASMRTYSANYPAAVAWINKTGLAVGRANYQVPQSTFNGAPSLMFATSGGSTAFAPVDACTQAPGKLCPAPVRENTPGYAGNHYRELNSAGTYFAIDLATGYIMEGKVGSPSASADLPLNTASIPCFSPFGIDDAGNFYYQQCPSGSLNTVYRYNITSKTSVQIPPIAGSDCTVYVPWTMNASGEMYGNLQSCNKSPSDMWVYNPKTNSTTDLSLQLPATVGTHCGGGYSLRALNDLGQILIAINSCYQQPADWGVLTPPT